MGYDSPVGKGSGPVYARTDGYVHRNVAGEALLVPVRAQAADIQSAYMLNETAEALYLGADGRRSEADLARLLADAFEVPADRAGADAKEALGILAEIGALEARR